jgi:hypothetical protein
LIREILAQSPRLYHDALVALADGLEQRAAVADTTALTAGCVGSGWRWERRYRPEIPTTMMMNEDEDESKNSIFTAERCLSEPSSFVLAGIFLPLPRLDAFFS